MADDMQDRIGSIWADMLGVASVVPDGNFFALGGHSLLAVKMLGALREKLELDSELSLLDLIENPTLEGFSTRVAELAAPSEEWGAI